MVPVSRTTAVVLLAAIVLMAAGCLPETPTTQKLTLTSDPISRSQTPEPLRAEALFDEWLDLAAKAEANMNNPRLHEITAQLAAKGPETLYPMIDYLGDPDASARAKILVVRSLKSFLAPVHIGPIHRVFKEQEDETSRACAIALLGFMHSPDVVPILRAALQDEQRRVRFAAMSGLVNNGDKALRLELSKLYQEEATGMPERLEILRVLLQSPQPEDIPVLVLALGIKELEPQIRTEVATFLGKVGDKGVIEPLRNSLELESDPMFQALGHTAIEAIEERESEPAADSS